jgi:hypothetical protein
MKTLALLLTFVSSAALADGSCKFSDAARLKEHLEKHIKYPATGKAIKDACAKEWPDEFSSAERACAGKKLADATQYKSAAEVQKALGVSN